MWKTRVRLLRGSYIARGPTCQQVPKPDSQGREARKNIEEKLSLLIKIQNILNVVCWIAPTAAMQLGRSLSYVTL